MHGAGPEDRTGAPKTPHARDAAGTQTRDAEGDIPWVSRAYQASIEENQCESISGSTPDVVINTDDTAAYRVKASPSPPPGLRAAMPTNSGPLVVCWGE